MSLPIHYHNRVIVGIFDQETIGLFATADTIPGQELGREDNAVEHQAEATAYEGRGPMNLFGPVEEIAFVSGIQGKGPPFTCLDTQLSPGEVAEANSIG
jgi:hypothetical protein